MIRTNVTESGAPCLTKASEKYEYYAFKSQDLHYKTSVAVISIGTKKAILPIPNYVGDGRTVRACLSPTVNFNNNAI